MKKKASLWGNLEAHSAQVSLSIIVLAAVIGFTLAGLSLTGCDNGDGDKTLVSIAVTTLPTKTEYTVGEILDLSGLVITATYSDGSTAAVSISAANISGFDSATAGQKTVTVSFGGKTTTFSVTVNPASTVIASIAVTTLPTKTEYIVGENLDLSGLVVTATYSDGSTVTVSISTENVSGFDSTTAGSKTITVTYQGKTATFSVVVNPASSTAVTSVDEVAAYLNGLSGGTSADNPVPLSMQINLGDMSQDGSSWRQLLGAIETAGKYVDLDISVCTMTGTDFSPGDMFGGMGQDPGREKIVSIVLPNAATSIGYNSGGMGGFRGFTNLKTFSGENITAIGNRVFSDCTSLAITSLPAGLQTIGMEAFMGCTGLTQLTLPDSVTSIGSAAFSMCKNLTNISIPASAVINSESGNAFFNCTSLTSFTITGSGDLKAIEGGKALVNGTELIAYPSASGIITLPTGLTSIGRGVFSGNRNITQVTLPIGVITIKPSAFEGCWNLSQIELPEGIVTIGDDGSYYAFSDCRSLTQLTLPDSVTSIDDYAFQSCTNLALVTCLAITPPKMDNSTFGYTSASLAIKVPAGSVAAYKAASGWSYYADRISAIE